jgi:hypothetical protein
MAAKRALDEIQVAKDAKIVEMNQALINANMWIDEVVSTNLVIFKNNVTDSFNVNRFGVF